MLQVSSILCSSSRILIRTLATLTVKSTSKKQCDDFNPAKNTLCHELVSVSDFSFLLEKCSIARNLPRAKLIHAQIKGRGLEQNISLINRLIWTYDKCGSPKDAWTTFEVIENKDIVSWNMMIGSYAHHGRRDLALDLFKTMLRDGIKPDKVTFLNTLNVCNKPYTLQEGRIIHHCILFHRMELDIMLATALVNMYGKCRALNDANGVFYKMPKKNVITWTAMISAYAHQGLSKAVIGIFCKMQDEGVLINKVTFITMLNACTNDQALADGKLFHAFIVERKPELGKVLGTALVSMYARCGSLYDARHMFDRLPLKQDVVLWTAMITAYSDYDFPNEALKLFQDMVMKGIKPNRITFASTLEASANMAAFLEGQLLHWYVLDQDIDSDVVVGNALINVYSKCGSVKDAHAVFRDMEEHDVISWNALISCYAQHGHGKEVIPLFQQMKRGKVKPDKITFISVLSACSHAGLVDEACYYFTLMTGEYNIKPNEEHYRCVADLLGRVGRVDEAEEFIGDMPYVPAAMAWSSLLGACKVHGNMHHGKDAAGHVLEFNSEDIAAITMLENDECSSIGD